MKTRYVHGCETGFVETGFEATGYEPVLKNRFGTGFHKTGYDEPVV